MLESLPLKRTWYSIIISTILVPVSVLNCELGYLDKTKWASLFLN